DQDAGLVGLTPPEDVYDHNVPTGKVRNEPVIEVVVVLEPVHQHDGGSAPRALAHVEAIRTALDPAVSEPAVVVRVQLLSGAAAGGQRRPRKQEHGDRSDRHDCTCSVHGDPLGADRGPSGRLVDFAAAGDV